jgi:EAL domain-containing protein (putative c-di-GMP-specific phosphodiesterase class I)
MPFSSIVAGQREAIFDELLGPEKIRTLLHPIRAIGNGLEVIGHEALMRGPRGVPYESPPLAFAMAATMGMVERLDTHCVRRAISLVTGRRLFINVHPRTIVAHRDFWGVVGGLSKESTSRPGEIVFEIVEHSAGSNADLSHALEELRALGFGLAVDDLGEGASGLRRLVEMEPDFAKIDRFFVTGIDQDRRKRAVVTAIAAAARDLGARVIAEGIENEREHRVLADLGVELGQGFLFDRPEEAH